MNCPSCNEENDDNNVSWNNCCTRCNTRSFNRELRDLNKPKLITLSDRARLDIITYLELFKNEVEDRQHLNRINTIISRLK